MTMGAKCLAIAIFILAAGVGGYVEGGVVTAMQARQAEISPPQPMCMSAQRRMALTGEHYWAERVYAHAQQADGGRWIIACGWKGN